MKRYEYDLSIHAPDAFKELVYFCAEGGTCSAEEVPADQTMILTGLLNERGRAGWELVQVAFNQQGLTAIWKRELT